MNKVTVKVGQTGMTLGNALAVAISWSRNHDVAYAIVHGFLSWAYVIWYCFFSHHR